MPARAGEREHGPIPGGNVRWLITPIRPTERLGSAPVGVGETAYEAARSVGLSLAECLDIQPLPPDASQPFEMPADPFRQLRGANDEAEVTPAGETNGTSDAECPCFETLQSTCARKRD